MPCYHAAAGYGNPAARPVRTTSNDEFDQQHDWPGILRSGRCDSAPGSSSQFRRLGFLFASEVATALGPPGRRSHRGAGRGHSLGDRPPLVAPRFESGGRDHGHRNPPDFAHHRHRGRGVGERRNAVEVVCKLEGQDHKIVELVPEGTLVKPGDVVIRLDPAQINDRLATQQIKVMQADALAKAAVEELKIQRNLAESKIAQAELALKLAELDKKKFLEGEYQASVSDLQGSMASGSSGPAGGERRRGLLPRPGRERFSYTGTTTGQGASGRTRRNTCWPAMRSG